MDDKEEIKTTKKEKEVKTVVVAQLPTQPVSNAIDEKGNEFTLLSIEEALTEILEKVRRLDKGLL